MRARTISTRTTRFLAEEDGTATITALYFVLICLVVGGVAVDFNKATSDKSQLQIAADTAAHAALYTRELEDVDTSKAAALDVIDGMLPPHQFGENPMITSDVTFGSWDFENMVFTASPNAKQAVRVLTQTTTERGNPSSNILLGIIGYDTFDVAAESIYSTYYPPCFTEGFVAEDIVDIQSNNSYFDGFCLHSNTYVSLNSNNYFEPGTVVSMPNLEDLDIPNSGFESNEGLQMALRQGEYRMRLLHQLPDIIASFEEGSSENLPDYVNSSASTDLSDAPDFGNGNKLTPLHFLPQQINTLTCYGAGKVTMEAGTYRNFVFVSNCEIKFAQGVILEEVVIATTNTSSSSLNAPSGLQVGRNDNCAEGGGSVLMTLGGVSVAAGLEVYNGQILAMGDIDFAANADGIQGASFVSRGKIDGTSNMNMGFCNGSGMENIYRAPYFRMVQ